MRVVSCWTIQHDTQRSIVHLVPWRDLQRHGWGTVVRHLSVVSCWNVRRKSWRCVQLGVRAMHRWKLQSAYWLHVGRRLPAVLAWDLQHGRGSQQLLGVPCVRGRDIFSLQRCDELRYLPSRDLRTFGERHIGVAMRALPCGDIQQQCWSRVHFSLHAVSCWTVQCK